MLLSVFCVYDSGVSTWMSPLFFRNKGEALRWWTDVCNNPETVVYKHPGDYTLFELGTWNDDSCQFDLLKASIRLGVAVEYKRTQSLDERGAGGATPSKEYRNPHGAIEGGVVEQLVLK